MSDSSSNNKRIAKNTLFLYGRMVITMLVSLFTSRVILRTLGVEDFGIYNLVGGVAAMFQFLNGTLADATQRYITVEIGKGDNGNVNKIFSTCLLLHVILGVLIILIAEPIGLWLIHNKLIIPVERLNAAIWVFHFSIVSLFVLIISVPYNALIIAHEKMKAFAMISIIEAVGKLLITYALLIGHADRLILYGILMLSMQTVIRCLYTTYCKRNFAETKYHFCWDKRLVKEMTGFASWTIIGNLAFVCITQGISVLLGMFFMPVVNAARGIAVQVQSAVSTFVKNFQTAINPQITKSYASGKISEMHSLVFRSSKYSFYLVMIPLIPIFLETDLILTVWLKDVPQYTAVFVRLIILVTWVNSLANPLSVSMKATGKIREYELYSASIKLLVIPVAYLLLLRGSSPVIVFFVYLFFEIAAYISNFIITGKYVNFSISRYCKEVIFKVFIVAITSFMIPAIIYMIMNATWQRFILVLIVSLFCSASSIFFIGMTNNERNAVLKHIKSYIYKNGK